MASVRVFGYRSTVQLPQRQTRHFTGESQFVREEPALWAQKLALNGAAPVETTVNADDKAGYIVIEVDDNTAVRFQINLNGPLASNHVNASTLSPKGQGEILCQWAAGATVSFVDAAAV